MTPDSPTTQPPLAGDEPLPAEDAAAVLDCFVSGEPLDPAILDRVRTRAEQVTETVRQAHGLVGDDTFQSLLDDEG